MKDIFLSNNSDLKFLDKIKENLKQAKAFYFSISFIKEAGLNLLINDIENALKRGVEGKLITSSYQNFTDISSLRIFLNWQNTYDNFECHFDFNCFDDNGFHSKGYIFEYDNSFEIVIGSSNLTRYALKKNIEWNISLENNSKTRTYEDALKEFYDLWDKTFLLNQELIDKYTFLLSYAIEKWDMDYFNSDSENIVPNAMQRKALKEIRRYRDLGVKRALIISATGSGKTYLAAFDAKNFDAKRVLFVVHRETILKDALNSFSRVFGTSKTYGLYTGNEINLDSDFIFASSTMLAKHLDIFDPFEFDYVCYDEVHHIVTKCGTNILNFFKPEFMLGLTATPERMDNQDVFSIFEQNVPFELRLRDAILNDLVVPFHYYGIKDRLIDYGSKNDISKISKSLAENENIDFIVDQIQKHKKHNEKLKCIAFCCNIAHAESMAKEFINKGYHAISLKGNNNTGERLKAFKELQDESKQLEIICAVDILNEGVDIPAINMVLFLRPTENSTIFLQQLGRGLRKYQNKDYLTVLDFIGNNYDRSVQIALALGTLSNNSYNDKIYLKDLIRTDFKTLNIPGLEIYIDDLSKEEIINYVDKTNFNLLKYLKKDYENFKKYLNCETYPKHLDYLNSELAPNLMRFIKSKYNGKKICSYYNFLSLVNEPNLPYILEGEFKLINKIEEMLPIVRADEFLIIKQLVNEDKINLDNLIGYNSRVNNESLSHALKTLEKNKIIKDSKFIINDIDNIKEYLNDVCEYALERYDREFGDFNGKYKLYGSYTKEQTWLAINKDFKMNIKLKGTYIDETNKEIYIWVDLNKDVNKKESLLYKDKFLSSTIFEWESEKNTKIDNSIGKKILNSNKAYIFIRKIKSEDNIDLPFTYFGTAKYIDVKPSFTIEKGKRYDTLLLQFELDEEVPEEYYLDFDIPKTIKE